MQTEDTPLDEGVRTGVITRENGIVVLSGYGLSIRVERGELEVRDGIGRDRREGRFHRVTGRIRRLVVLGHTGSISLEAIRWLADIGAAYLQIDADGRVIAAFAPLGTDRPGLRRAQALAVGKPAGIAIARDLLRRKLLAQADTIEILARHHSVDAEAGWAVRNLAEALAITSDIDGLRLIEASAAATYWGAWSTLPIRFARRDVERVPAHWRTFGSRSSPLTGGPRLAVSPSQALLNLSYALLEAEATIAARTVGLDPGLGIIHADRPNRDSLSADLMEPIRPLVDRWVIELLARRSFAARDFFETRDGVCRVTPPLTHELAASAAEWGRLVGTIAEDVARALDDRRSSDRPVATPISGRNRATNRTRGRAPRSRPTVARVMMGSTCTWCGTRTSVGRRTCPGACEAAERKRALAAFVTAGVTRAHERREAGVLPRALEPGERRRIGERTSDLVGAARAWQGEHEWPVGGAFEREVLPALEVISAGAIARATGLSRGYCQQIKRGKVRPHPMWWETLRDLGITPSQARSA